MYHQCELRPQREVDLVRTVENLTLGRLLHVAGYVANLSCE